jgi:hypothetical protein
MRASSLMRSSPKKLDDPLQMGNKIYRTVEKNLGKNLPKLSAPVCIDLPRNATPHPFAAQCDLDCIMRCGLKVAIPQILQTFLEESPTKVVPS